MAAWKSSPRRASPRCKKSEGDLAAPADPTGPLVSSAVVAVQNDKPAVIKVETKNFSTKGVVQVRAAQKWDSANWMRASCVSANQALWRETSLEMN